VPVYLDNRDTPAGAVAGLAVNTKTIIRIVQKVCARGRTATRSTLAEAAEPLSLGTVAVSVDVSGIETLQQALGETEDQLERIEARIDGINEKGAGLP